MATHSLSAMQPRQVLLAVQMGVVPEQVLLPVHCTQAPLPAQAGAVGLLMAHWLDVVQALQVLFVQMGVAPEHPALVRHCTHLLVVGSQTGVVPEQVLLSVHCTHCPAPVPLVAHAGAAGLLAAHWAGVLQAVQTFAVQMGVVAGQVMLDTHWTHLLVVGSQTDVVPEQVLLSVHATHCPALGPLVAQAGVVGLLAAHWLAVVQAVQTFAVQMGVAPEHPALVRHCTHLFVVGSQTGVAPEQVLLSMHWTQVPVAEQAGVAGFLAAH
jgi:sulfur relay (sulfurtransferase) DsrC/TusE family protein